MMYISQSMKMIATSPAAASAQATALNGSPEAVRYCHQSPAKMPPVMSSTKKYRLLTGALQCRHLPLSTIQLKRGKRSGTPSRCLHLGQKLFLGSESERLRGIR